MTGAEIISAFLAEKRVAREDVLRGHEARFVKLRLLVIHRLRQAGLTKTEIARAMEKTRDGMSYWLTEEWKEADTAARWLGIADGACWGADSQSNAIQVCNDHKIYPAEFFGKGRDKRLTAARREAMQIMHNRGFSMAATARMLKLNYKTVIYWMNPNYQEYSRRSARASLARSLERRPA